MLRTDNKYRTVSFQPVSHHSLAKHSSVQHAFLHERYNVVCVLLYENGAKLAYKVKLIISRLNKRKVFSIEKQ